MANAQKEKSVPCWTEEKEMAAFRSIPEPDASKAAALLPSLMQVCTLVGRTESMSWLWVLVTLATVSCQLAPRDRLELCPAVQVHGALWTALLHPGSTNTMKHVRKALELLYAWVNKSELDAAKQEHDQEAEAALAAQEKAPKFVPPPKRKGTAGGGSLAAAGATAAQEQNRGAFTAVEPELAGILAWLLQESAVDSAVPGKLWDAVTWDRPVMSSAKAFAVQDPFFSFAAAGHLRELLLKLMQDSLGLRQRLTVVFARPLFLNLAEVDAACQALPPETQGRPQLFMARFLAPLLRWSLRTEAEAVQHGQAAGAIFRPSAEAGAKGMVAAKFDFRNQKQQAHFLEPNSHGLAKYHGKLKTKYDRMVLGVFYLQKLSQHHERMKQLGIPMDSWRPRQCKRVSMLRIHIHATCALVHAGTC